MYNEKCSYNEVYGFRAGWLGYHMLTVLVSERMGKTKAGYVDFLEVI